MDGENIKQKEKKMTTKELMEKVKNRAASIEQQLIDHPIEGDRLKEYLTTAVDSLEAADDWILYCNSKV